MFVLNGFSGDEDFQSLFTHGERATALGVAKEWLRKEWHPFLFSKTYDGKFKVLLNYRNASHKQRKAA